MALAVLVAAAAAAAPRCDKAKPFLAPADARLEKLLAEGSATAAGSSWFSMFGGGGGSDDDCSRGSKWLGAYTEAGLDPSPLAAFTAEHNQSLHWGTYRPAHYFSLRTRTAPAAVVAGLLWGHAAEAEGPLRHDCREGDRLKRYGWRQHDGRAYGLQDIEDPGTKMTLQTAFVKPDFLDGSGDTGVEWAARVTATAPRTKMLKKKGQKEGHRKAQASLWFYVSVDCDGLLPAGMPCLEAARSDGLNVRSENGGVVVTGRADGSMKADASTFDVHVSATGGDLTWGCVPDASAADAPAHARRTLSAETGGGCSLAVVRLTPDGAAAGDAAAVTLDVAMTATKSTAPAQQQLTDWFAAGAAGFAKKFTSAFPRLGDGGDATAEQVATAQFAISNLIGSAGFFHGRLEIKDSDGAVLRSVDPISLFTMVPSRPFFPRGFLWDEGFHHLAALAFDRGIVAESLTRWLLTLRGAEGCTGAWLPREQAIGADAASRVPDEFRAQDPRVANPPTLMLAAEQLLVGDGSSCEDSGALGYSSSQLRKALVPRLRAWSDWLAKTQNASSVAYPTPGQGLYRWHGRDANDGRLVPMTLSSGLDDYPRSYFPSEHEAHSDLSAWVAASERSLARMLSADGADTTRHTARFEAAVAALEQYHWDDSASGYVDLGLAAEVKLRTEVVISCQNDKGEQSRGSIPKKEYMAMSQGRGRSAPGSFCPKSHPKFQWPLGDGKGGLLERQQIVAPCAPTPGKMKEHVGYASFMPLFLRLLPYEGVSKDRIDAMAIALRDPSLLSKHGIRSLSTKSPMYQQFNAPGDEPYWRGYIWWCMNYLAMRSLNHYAEAGSAEAARTYSAVREHITSATVADFAQTNWLCVSTQSRTNGKKKCIVSGSLFSC